jgi:hypothetical protein
MRIRLVLFLLATLAPGGIAPALVQETDPSALLKTADEMVQVTARLRSLQPKSPISRGVKSRAEISQYLDEDVRDNYSQSELQEEGKLLRILGLMPASIDYKELVLKLYTEQIAGFYDPAKKTFYIASWLPTDEQKPTMVHELDHALQDQYFNIEKIRKEDLLRHNDDEALAHEAFLEGEAIAVMLNYQLEPVKRTFSQLPDLASVMGLMLTSMKSQFPVFNGAPPFLQETLFFPYRYGAGFLQKIWMQNPSWETVNKVYSDLPASTEQIMHPEKYYGARDNPKPVDAAPIVAKLGGGWKVEYKNILGEFSLGLLLSQQLSEEHSRRSAAGWGGDQVLLLENGAGKNAVLVDTVWDNADEAEKFFQSIQAWFLKRYPNAGKSDETPAGFSLTQDKEIHSLRHEGAEVRFIIGLPESDAKLLAGF